MKTKMLVLGVVMMAVGTVGISSPSAKSAAKANNTFGFNLLKKVTKQTEKGNKFVSPLSLYLALAMLDNGAQNETQVEIERVLSLSGVTRDEANASNLALLDSLNAKRDLVLKVANSLWGRQGFTMRQDFLSRVKNFYRASATELDFSLPLASKTINGWVFKATNEKIDKIVPDQISAETVLFLINAAYFEAEWAQKFKDGATRLAEFNLEGGAKVRVPTLTMDRGRYKTLTHRGMRAIELPYKGNEASMVVVVPAGGNTVDSLVSSLDESSWSDLVTELGKQEAHSVPVALPKLKFSYDSESSLNDVLKSMGMPRAFNQRSAQLKGISDVPGNLYVSNVKQKTFVQVDEEGTKAAAVSSVEIGLESAIGGEPFRVDRPYLFAVKDNATGAVLFVGTVKHPEGGEMPKPKPGRHR